MNPAYVAHGATLSFVWFLIVNVALSAAIAIAVRFMPRPRSGTPGFWLTLRLLPALAAVGFVLAVFVPSYLEFEPRESVEAFDVMRLAIAALGAAIVVAAIARAWTAWSRVAQRTRSWMRLAQPLALAETTLPAYAIDVDRPLIALVGLFRPTLLITRGLIDALTPAELSAVVAHEIGHVRSFDNLKRLAACAAPDVLRWLGAASTLEQRWMSAAEHSADRLAGRDSAETRCALASALVKVARLTSVPPVLDHVSTLISGGDITSRVEALLTDREAPPLRVRRPLRYGLLAAAAIAVAAGYLPVLHSVHEVTEILVRALP